MLLALMLGVLTMGQVLAPVGDLWTREPNVGTMTRTENGVKIVHTGEKDWALNLGEPFAVQPGDVVVATTTLSILGEGTASLSVTLRSGEEVLLWTAGHRPLTGSRRPQTSRTVAIVPNRATSAQVRLTGEGPTELEFGRVRFELTKLPKEPESAPLLLESKELRVEFEPTTLAVTVNDRRNGRRWRIARTQTLLHPSKARVDKGVVHWEGLAADGLLGLTVELELKGAELRWTISPIAIDAPAPDLSVPGAIEPSPTAEHVLPVNMGLRVAANDAKFEPLWLPGYGGHGLCMAFYGLLDGGAGVLNLVGDSDDFLLAVERDKGLLRAKPVWRPQLGKFVRYPRHLTQVFFDKADLNDFAQRYRVEAKRKGLLVPLAAKARKNPNVARVARAANLWTWSDDKVGLAQAAHDAGFRNVLWSGGGSPEVLRKVASLGFVPSRYDIYQDVMDPSKLADLPWTHPDWTTEAWPNGLVRNQAMDWVRGWVVQDKQGKDVPCAVCCDLEALAIAKKRIGDELKSHPFQARFIDTTTASEYRECYDLRHPMTRAQSREARMKLLQLVTDFGLVTGSETGHEAAVPHLVFFEGMMSLGPYRVDDAGTDPPKPYDRLPDKVLTYQLGLKYRIPLWQLVYGDCTVSTWYWGDFSNKNDATWDLRDRWNMLYGTPPMYFTDAAAFGASRARFAKSYQDTQKVLTQAAMRRMTRFEDLTADRSVQRTTWDNGLRVTVNFGERPFGDLGPNQVRVEEPKSPRKR